MWWMVLAAQIARADYYDRQESIVLGASVVIGLGQPAIGHRVGFGVDVGYQYQKYWERGHLINGEFTHWADEGIAPNWGPVGHLWYAEKSWFLGAGVRAGATWPLRVGVGRGWRPGPGLTGELGLLMSTNGKVGLDGQAVVDGPFVQLRVGTALGFHGFHTARVSVGAFAPLVAPENLDGVVGDVWDPSKTVVLPDGSPDSMSGYTITGY